MDKDQRRTVLIGAKPRYIRPVLSAAQMRSTSVKIGVWLPCIAVAKPDEGL